MKSIFRRNIAFAAALVAPALAQQAPQPPQPPSAPRARAAVVIGQAGPYLGVGIMDIDSARAKALKLNEERGVEITRVDPGGPADKAGLKVNDVILEWDGQRVESMEQLQRLVHESVAGRAVKLGVWRNGAMQTITASTELRREPVVTVPSGTWGVDGQDNWPFAFPMEIPQMQTVMQNPVLGVQCEALGDEQQFAEFFGVKDGLLVKMTMPDMPATRAGIKAGDVIIKVDDTRVGTMRELTAALRAAVQKGSYQVTVVRNKKEMQIAVSR